MEGLTPRHRHRRAVRRAGNGGEFGTMGPDGGPATRTKRSHLLRVMR